MTIEYYEIIKDPDAVCSQCGTHEDIVMDGEGDLVCTDCLFEQRCQEYEREPGRPLPWYYGPTNNREER